MADSMVDTVRSPNPALSRGRTNLGATGSLGQQHVDEAEPLPSGLLELSDLGTFVPIEPEDGVWDTDDDDPTIAIGADAPGGTSLARSGVDETAPPAAHRATWRHRIARATLAVAVASIAAVSAAMLTHFGPFSTMHPQWAAAAISQHIDDIARPTTLGPKPLSAAATAAWASAVSKPPAARELRLPTPLPVPADAYAPANYADIGQIEIPKIGLQTTLHQGMTLTSIDRGPSYWPGSAYPGSLGNVVIAGHRVSNSRPFYRIDELAPGDLMKITVASGQQYTYRATGAEIVDPEQLSIVGQRPAYEATIFACHPRGSARLRYVVHFELLDSGGRPVQLGEYRLVQE